MFFVFLLFLYISRINAFNETTANQTGYTCEDDIRLLKTQVNSLTKSVDSLLGALINGKSHFAPGDTDVAFLADLSHDLIAIPPRKIVLFDNVIYNAGGGYDKTTGIFTCPQTGLYLFSFFTSAADNRLTELLLWIDGSIFMHAVSKGVYETGGNVLVFRLLVGQQVWIETTSDVSLSGLYTTFSAVLIHQ